MKYLLDKNPSYLNNQTRDGLTALMIAAGAGYTEIVKLVMDKQVKKHLKDGTTALMIAATQNRVEVIKLLLPFEQKMAQQQGWMASHYAAQNNAVDALKILLEAEGNNPRTNEKATCLMLAAEKGKTDTVKYLLTIVDPKTNIPV